MASKTQSLGVIAGNGIYPVIFSKAARKAGVQQLSAAAFFEETESSLEEVVDAMEWFRVGQLSKMIKFFRKCGVERTVMTGQIDPKNLFDVRPDLRTLILLGKLKKRNAESIFGAIGEELDKEGMPLISAISFLEDCLPQSGLICGKALSKRQREDADYGFEIAKEVSRLDIGQSVVVKNGTVLAVEAFEGTNEAIQRGGALGKGKAVLIKVSKPNQDFRFDVPVVGPETIRIAARAGIETIVVETGKTLLLEKEKIFELCEKNKITIFAK